MAQSGWLTDAATSERMKGIRQRETRPEQLLRKLIWSLGGRYRCNDKRLPGSPDIVNRKQKWAIFVHGCFWHGHPGCKKATIPKRNTGSWIEKIASNRRRDQEKVDALHSLGYEVIVVWECEVERLNKLGLDSASPELLGFLERFPFRHPKSKVL
jgi:DNA mismatch endonuclease, patch repair protein